MSFVNVEGRVGKMAEINIKFWWVSQWHIFLMDNGSQQQLRVLTFWRCVSIAPGIMGNSSCRISSSIPSRLYQDQEPSTSSRPAILGWQDPFTLFLKVAHFAPENANIHSPPEVPCSQMINGGLEVFPPAHCILELHFLFLGTVLSHLLPCSTFAASGCRNWLGSKANWRSKMIFYWLFFNKGGIATRNMSSVSTWL